MDIKDVQSLSEKTRADGGRLFGVCEFLYKINQIFIIIIGIIGIIGFLILMQQGSTYLGIAVAVLTFFCCFLLYILSVLTTHFGKVLVHNSFACMGLLEYFTEVGKANGIVSSKDQR